MKPVLSRRSLPFLVLGVFALLFGVAQSASAVDCQDWETGVWNKEPSCDETLQYSDIGGSNLSTCEYRVVSVNDAGGFEQTFPASGWTSAGNCNGATPPWTSPAFSISIGSAGYCKYEGTFRCIVYWRAQDGAGNTSTDYSGDGVAGPAYKIDYSSPSGGSISYTDGFTASTSVVLTVDDGTDIHSGINTATRIVQRRSASLSGGVCGAYGSFANVSVTGTYPSFTNSGLVTNTCYQYQYLVKDNVGHQATYTSSSTVKVDTTPPTVTSVSSDKPNGSYTTGAVIDIDVTFSEAVTSTGNVTVTLETGTIDRTCTFTVSAATTGTCNYTVQTGDTSPDLTVSSISGAIKDAALNAMTNFVPAINLAANKAIVVDTVAPTITSFTINGTECSGSPCTATITTNIALNIAWATNNDTGGSGIQRYEVWRAWDANGDGTPQSSEWNDNSPVSGIQANPIYQSPTVTSTTDNPPDGTYWYGIHTLDNASNCISENTTEVDKGHACGGAVSDSLDTRADKGPIKVVMDKRAPVTFLRSVAGDEISPYWDVQNDGETDIIVSGETGILCRVRQDDAAYSFPGTKQDCSVSGSAVTCSLGNFGTFGINGQGANKRFYVSCKDAAGNEQSTSQNLDVVFGADWTAPGGSITVNGGATYATSASVTLGLSCTDNVSGCDKMRFSNDGTSFSSEETFAAAKTWTLTSGDGIKTVYVRYKDVAGNESGSFTDTIFVDTVAPPKPTCSPAGGTFQNKANNVICSAEAGAAIRYTLTQGGSSPDSSSTPYSSPFDISGSAILIAAAWDQAGNRSPNSDPYSFTILHNQAPTITSTCSGSPGCDSPDPIKANAQITFTASWTDPDAGDQTKLHICKTNAISGTQTCTGGSWFDSASFSTISPTVGTYTIQAADAGTKNYYAFVCDDEDACSSSESGTFLVDAQVPIITTFAISPESPAWANKVSPSITVTWNVSDQGGSYLDKVRVYRAPFGPGCDNASKTSCVWTQAGSDVVAPLNSDNWNCPSCAADAPGSGTWWYGIHVTDKVGNCTREDGSSCTAITGSANLKKALVDTQNPSTAVTSPAAATWFNRDFSATFDDSDTGGSGLVPGASGCQYRFIGDNPSGSDVSSGDLMRQCDPVIKAIAVGPSPDVCRFEGIGRCRVETKSFDVAGNTSSWQTVLYGVDFTLPIIGSPVPNSAQSGVSTNYSATLRDPMGKIIGCAFYWRAVGGDIWNTGVSPTVNPIPCENNANCTVSVSHAFASPGSYETLFGCTDQATNTGWGGVTTVQVGSLSVDLSVVPTSGSINTLFDLVADTAGSTMTGDTTYGFDCRIDTGDCMADGNFDDCDFSITTSQTAYTAADLCQYPAIAGTYTAKVAVQRGVGTAQDTVVIGPISTNNVPTTTNRSVDAPNSTDYCGVTGYPPVRVRWVFSDDDPGDTQGAYEIEVFKDAVSVFTTGKKTGTTQEYVFQSAGEQLLWNTTYTWQVRVWDSPNDDVSTFLSGPQFTTPSHYYPVPSFTWSPAFPGAEELVQFTNQTNFAPGASSKTWSWNFGDTGSSISQNPTHTYAQVGAFGVTLQAGDNVGSCSNLQTVNVSVPFPEWQEISPF